MDVCMRSGEGKEIGSFHEVLIFFLSTSLLPTALIVTPGFE
jgi:hypothetical protein